MKRYSLKNNYQILLCTLLASYTLPSSAATFERLESKPLDELWLTAGFYSFHFEPDQPLEDNNIGAGLEYRYSTTSAFVAGRFRNSEKIISSYAAAYWQPLALGPVRLGALVGVINGYNSANNGNWFPLALPMATTEYKRIGISLTIVPSIQNVVHGSISLQLRVKLF